MLEYIFLQLAWSFLDVPTLFLSLVFDSESLVWFPFLFSWLASCFLVFVLLLFPLQNLRKIFMALPHYQELLLLLIATRNDLNLLQVPQFSNISLYHQCFIPLHDLARIVHEITYWSFHQALFDHSTENHFDLNQLPMLHLHLNSLLPPSLMHSTWSQHSWILLPPLLSFSQVLSKSLVHPWTWHRSLIYSKCNLRRD